MPANLTIWCNAKFSASASAELAEGTSGHRLVVPDSLTTNLGSSGPSPLLAEADVAFGQPDPIQIIELPKLKWVHLTSAGYTRYDKNEIRKAFAARDAWLTNSSFVFADPCAQHILAFMLAQDRQLPASVVSQNGPHAWIYDRLRPMMRILAQESVLILGYGAIARRLIELLAPFQLEITAIRRTVYGDEVVPTYPIEDVIRLLPSADHVVNVLPSNPTTERLVDASYFEAMKHGAAFYNVGRGTTVNHEALKAALDSGHLGGAYLDVTDPEPLPSDNPLWVTPNCWITPHVAGGRQDEDGELVRHFLRNLRKFEAGQPLKDRII